MSTSTEVKSISFFLERIMDDVIAQLHGISDADLNRSIDIPECNSIFKVTAHMIGSAEYWVLSMAGGREIKRDRKAEFEASGTGAELIARCTSLLAEMKDILQALPDERLNQPAPGEEPLTVRDGLLHTIEHCAIHLGHLQLSRQIIGYAPPQKTE